MRKSEAENLVFKPIPIINVDDVESMPAVDEPTPFRLDNIKVTPEGDIIEGQESKTDRGLNE